MRQSVLFLVFSFLFCFYVSAQIPAIQWQKTIGGSSTDNVEGPKNISAKIQFKTKTGTTIIAGTTYSNDGDILPNRGMSDIFIGELDEANNWLWKKSYGGSGFEYLVSLQPAGNDSGFIALASTTSNDQQITGNHGKSDAWVLRLDNLGNIIWQKCFGGTANDDGAYITKVQNSGYVFVGTSNSNNGDVSGIHINTGDTLINTGDTSINAGDTLIAPDIWAVRIDENGNKLWSKTFGGNSYLDDIGTIIKPTTDGGFICGGVISSSNFDGQGNHGSNDIWLAKLDGNGIKEWSKCYGGTSNEYLGDIETDIDGGFLIVGSTSSNDGDVSGLHGLVSGNTDAWIAKVSGNGSLIWQKCIGGTGNESFEDVTRAPDGSYLAVGYSGVTSGDITSNKGGYDCLIAKISDSGNLIWTKSIGGSANDFGLNIFSFSETEIFILGETESNNFDVAGNHGASDIWLVKLGNTSIIKGSAYYDENANGVKDGSEKWVDNVMVTASKSNYERTALITKGQFAIEVDTGSYVTTIQPNSPYYQIIPASITSTFTSYFQSDSISFALQPIPGKTDLSVNIVPITAARPGFDVIYKVYYKNSGTVNVANGEVWLKYDDRLTFISASPAMTRSNGDTLKWNYTDLKPADTSFISVQFKAKTPPTLTISDSLKSVAIINPAVGDETPTDNTAYLTQRVTGSYDPNDKTENHNGTITPIEIRNDEYLNYTIRFQNMGNDTAFNIVVRDTLDSKLDWKTLQMVAASHSYSLNISNGINLAWKFDNIRLPYKDEDAVASNGFISYRIKPKRTLNLNDAIHNTASIYFDYNPAVVTNDATTTVQQFTVLPLHLISFSGNYHNEKAILHWTSVNEYAFDCFEIERSLDDKAFQRIGKERSAGKRNQSISYLFEDDLKNIEARNVYYRLKMVDLDGKITFSKVILIHIEENKPTAIIYPNPVRWSESFLSLYGKTNSLSKVSIVDALGRIVAVQNVQVLTGANLISLNRFSKVKPGVYTLVIKHDGLEESIRLVVTY